MKITRKYKQGFIAAAAVAALVPAGMIATADGATTTRTVTLKAKRFHPASVTISKGSKVKWVWADPGHAVPHNIVASKFKGTGIRQSGSYTVTFRKAGTFTYKCTIHPGMVGKVIVH
jgi:plastocyanin